MGEGMRMQGTEVIVVSYVVFTRRDVDDSAGELLAGVQFLPAASWRRGDCWKGGTTRRRKVRWKRELHWLLVIGGDLLGGLVLRYDDFAGCSGWDDALVDARNAGCDAWRERRREKRSCGARDYPSDPPRR